MDDEDLPIDEDDLAGIVELFGALTRAELRRATSELCFRLGVDAEEEPIDAAIDEALDSFALLVAPPAVDPALSDDPIVAGPTAFPALSDEAEDLPHILDVEPREIDRSAAGRAAVERLRDRVDAAVDDEDETAADLLLDLCYDVETWSPVSVDDERDRLRTLLDG